MRKAKPAAKSPGAMPAKEPADVARAANALWWLLAALLALRAWLTFVPNMWGWSLNVQRFLAPAAGWGLWLIAAAPLLPVLVKPITRWLERVARWQEQHGAIAIALWAVGAALLVLLLPDRTQFVGDFLLRQNTLRTGSSAAAWYPQALPLDLWLHDSLARALMSGLHLDANGSGRFLGAIEAGLVGALAAYASRALQLRGAAAIATSCVVLWGGFLTMFTGYNKCFSETTLVTAAVAVFGLDLLRRGRGLLGFALALTFAFALHRSSIALVPAMVAVWVLHFRCVGRAPVGVEWAALALPVLTLGFHLPRILHIVSAVDPVHFAPPDVAAHGLASATLGGLRVPDMLQLFLMLAPLAPALILLGPRAARTHRGEAAFLAALLVPMLAAVPFIHPGQGYFRDWDDFSAAGAALGVASAWAIGELLRSLTTRAWLAGTVAAAAIAPAFAWLVHFHDLEAGIARARAFVTEEPERPAMERYTTWLYLGVRESAAARPELAASALAEAAAVLPTPHVMRLWAAAEERRGAFGAADSVYRQMVARDSTASWGWRGLATSAMRRGDWSEARRTAERTIEIDSTDAAARALLSRIDREHPERAQRPPTAHPSH